MNTFMMLMVAYNGRPDLDVKTVAENHFNLTEGKFLKKVDNHEIDRNRAIGTACLIEGR